MRAIYCLLAPFVFILIFAACAGEQAPVKEITITITADNSIELNGEPVSLADLQGKLAAMRITDKTRISLQAVRETDMGVIQDVQNVLRDANIGDVSFTPPAIPDTAAAMPADTSEEVY